MIDLDKDHLYIFKVKCSTCSKASIEKVRLSQYIEPEFVWRVFLMLTGSFIYRCRKCLGSDKNARTGRMQNW